MTQEVSENLAIENQSLKGQVWKENKTNKLVEIVLVTAWPREYEFEVKVQFSAQIIQESPFYSHQDGESIWLDEFLTNYSFFKPSKIT